MRDALVVERLSRSFGAHQVLRDIPDRVCFLDAGRILEEGTPETIFTAPRQERTQQFLQRIIEARRL